MKKSTMMLWAGVLFAASAVIQTHAVVPPAAKQVPGTMNYQGRLMGLENPYVNGTYTFDIRLYTAATGGTPLWGGTYASYVKDGYFNIMLGGTGGSPLGGTTYTHTDLWKALWPDPVANGALGDPLYLGITPWQSEGNGPIDPGSRIELSPRQTLLTAPYAFRAQTAEYANQASGDFLVSKKLTAATLATANGLVSADFTGLRVGTESSPAGTVNINAVGVAINAGNTDLALNSTDRIDLKAQGKLYLESQNMLTVSSKSHLDMESTLGEVRLTGNLNVDISSPNGNITFDPGNEVRGYNKLTWTVPGNTTHYSPMKIKKIDVPFAPNVDDKTVPTSFGISAYSVMIVGIESYSATITGFVALKDPATGFWVIRLHRTGTINYACTPVVTVLAITKNWTDDTP